jgi:hypothetical protein
MPPVRPVRPGEHGARHPLHGPPQDYAPPQYDAPPRADAAPRRDQGQRYEAQRYEAQPRHAAGQVRQPDTGRPQGPGQVQEPGWMADAATGYADDPARLDDQPNQAQRGDENRYRDTDGPAPGERPGGRTRALSGRARRALLRRRRRSVVVIGGAIVAIIAVLVTVFVTRSNGSAAVIPNDFITTFQPGELQQVPNACQVIPPATIQQYLPGKIKQAAPLPIDGKLGSACNWTLDHQPTYRLLELNMLAYAPNGLASGNGIATSAATDAYMQAFQSLQDPPKGTVGGKATVTAVSGLGDEAFSSMQVFRVGGAVSYQATVTIRFHNVLVTVGFSGLEHSNKGHYGPVSQSQLAGAAMAFAQDAYASLH